MKYKQTGMGEQKEILANEDWAGIPHTFTADAKAGDVVEGIGVCLSDVTAAENPNGTVIYRGIIDMRKLADNQKPTSAQVAALPLIKWLNKDNTFFAGS